MQKWEYQFVACDYSGEWRPRWINTQELDNWKHGSSIDAYSNQLGDNGWELVSVNLVNDSGGRTWAYRLIFKCPKE